MSSPAPPDVASAADIIRGGGLVGMPTETVYGLAADATNDLAVARIYETKGRPSFNPLIVHVSGQQMAEREAEFSRFARRLALAFWPGPLTMVLPRRQDASVSLLVSAGLDTLAIRMPAHPVAHDLIRAAERPLAAPSANISGAVSPTTAQHVADGLDGKIDMILDGGPTEIGLESTILKIDGERAILLRPGGLAVEEIEERLGAQIERPQGGAIEAPGMLASHYAPQSKLMLNIAWPSAHDFYLDFGDSPFARRPNTLNLSRTGSLREAAANLFAYLRAADAACRARGLKMISAAPIPCRGLGEAINDRLARAAAPRPQR
ncbi:MAG: L-threonylcarbamoyladenylate synthase [Pseudomonadota bacterium]|nr:L-threonylcarbamoyladenylate synthase [Pseudomonadota bacterium]